ncbi:hypothetical protein [Mitsuaria sp. GD03876]|uniref:hypothetical protein n=1 Tax=Mitsuaria sp. GD03876 TaxID=2975399 RepID=UPI002446F2CA|nr:hypothetical protein [Mitsuaria sp. GD03876]MDH0864000.1 hypothetical protein [Mitsuaria sp. GD03876]
MAAPSAAGAQTWGGTLTAVTERVSRGISLSGDHPGATADLYYRDDRNWSLGLGLGTMRAAYGATTEVILSGTRWWQLDDRRTVMVSAAHYAYAGGAASDRLRYSEVSAGGTWDMARWGQWSGTLSVSPDLSSSNAWGYLGHRGATLVELTWHRRLVGPVAADLGWGLVDPWARGSGAYRFANAGLSVSVGDWRFSVTRLYSSVPRGNDDALQRWVGGVAWSF